MQSGIITLGNKLTRSNKAETVHMPGPSRSIPSYISWRKVYIYMRDHVQEYL